MVGVDIFGIAKLNETSPYGVGGDGKGWEYYSTEWNERHIPEHLVSDSWFIGMDSYMHFQKLYGALVKVYADGTNRIKLEHSQLGSSTNLSLSIYDERNLKAGIRNALNKWRGRRWSPNVEFTVYLNKKASYSGEKESCRTIEIHLTTDHHFGTINPYNSHDYTLNLRNDGRLYFGGEPYHGTTRSPKPEGITEIDFWDTDFNGIPLDTDIGLKVIKRTSGNGRNVFLELYRDMTNGYRGGNWTKLFEFEHVNGNWQNSAMSNLYDISIANPTSAIIIPDSIDMPHAHDGGMCGIRISPVKELELKWLSCRDILPVFIPQTTTQELTASGDSGETESGL